MGDTVFFADGQTNPEIAEKLIICLKTVRNHVSNIFSKLQVAEPSGGCDPGT